MSTRSTIAVLHADGTVSQAYCHFDGYLEHNGRELFASYRTLQLAEALVSGGDMSSLGATVDDTVYYCRDRGEDYNVREFASLHDYDCAGGGEEYNYLFREGRWEVATPYSDDRRVLAEALESEF